MKTRETATSKISQQMFVSKNIIILQNQKYELSLVAYIIFLLLLIICHNSKVGTYWESDLVYSKQNCDDNLEVPGH